MIKTCPFRIGKTDILKYQAYFEIDAKHYGKHFQKVQYRINALISKIIHYDYKISLTSTKPSTTATATATETHYFNLIIVNLTNIAS